MWIMWIDFSFRGAFQAQLSTQIKPMQHFSPLSLAYRALQNEKYYKRGFLTLQQPLPDIPRCNAILRHPWHFPYVQIYALHAHELAISHDCWLFARRLE